MPAPEKNPAKIIKELELSIEALYNSILLRDFTGKVIPGCLTLLGAAFIFSAQGDSQLAVARFLNKIHQVTKPEAIFVVCFSWITALCLQSLGDRTHFFPFSWTEEFQSKLNVFEKEADEDEKSMYRRYTVVKESSGTTATALSVLLLCAIVKSVCFVVTAFHHHNLEPNFCAIILYIWWICVWVGAILLLRHMYLKHKARQESLVEKRGVVTR